MGTEEARRIPTVHIEPNVASETALGAVDRINEGSEVQNNYNAGQETRATDHAIEDGQGNPTSKRAKVRRLRRKTKEKTKSLLGMDGHITSDSEADAQQDVAQQLHNDPAFNPAQIRPSTSEHLDGPHSSPKRALKSVATAITHPKNTIKDKMTKTAAGKLSGAQRPYLSPEADREFLQAHDNLSQVTSRRASSKASDNDTDDAAGKARREVEKLEDHRQSLKAGWTTSRHVDRVRVVQNMLPPFPNRESFVERDPAGNNVRYRWEKFIGYVLLYYSRPFTAQYIDDFDDLPFDIDTLSRTVERLVVASAPWQAWYMSVRTVYRWEDPKLTGKWFALFVVLWYTEHIVGFFYAYILYAVIRERYYPTSVDAVRESLDRVLKKGAQAYHLGDLVDKHGRDQWLDPLLDELGPYLQLQLGDMADIAEVLSHFYYWSSPRNTAASLFFFLTCLLVTLLTDMRFCVKIVSFLAGGWFFVCCPISSRYPKYRYLVDPLKWAMWDIPTNAEWSLELLRQKAHLQQRDIDSGGQAPKGFKDGSKRLSQQSKFLGSQTVEDLDPKSTSEPDGRFVTPPYSTKLAPANGLFAFSAVSHGHSGRLIIDRDGVRFHRPGKETTWKIFYSRLVEMRKARPPKKTGITALGRDLGRIELYFKFERGGEMMEEVDIKDGRRDEVFNIILGWSGLRWRALQLSRAAVKGDGQRHLGLNSAG